VEYRAELLVGRSGRDNGVANALLAAAEARQDIPAAA